MLNIVTIIMILISVGYGVLSGNDMQDISSAVITSGSDAIELLLTLIGTMATWGGILKVAEDSGMIDWITRLLTPILRLLFKNLDKKSKALQAISMNVTANILGLGNAATPLGIEAMKRLEEEEGGSESASKSMITLALLNTSSIEIIPTTVIALRTMHGSNSPAEIIPCVIIVSVISVCVCLASASVFESFKAKDGGA